MSDASSGRNRRLFSREPRAEVDEELAFHIEERVRDYIARGMDPDAARAAALERLGNLDPVRSECAGLLTAERRAAARRDWVKFSWLDFKLAFRMLVRYPGLTLVGGLAMAFAIATGATAFEAVKQIVHPTLPLKDGDRIVAVQNWDAAANRARRSTAQDLASWRAELAAVEELGAYRGTRRNLITADGDSRPLDLAEITASAFRVTGVRPELGRPLAAADEQPGAPDVVVIGYDVWQSRFGGDRAVIGRTVRLGSTPATIVGVMPEGFGFPIAHSLWTPLRLSAADYAPGAGPQLTVFGRLADGVSLGKAQAEAAGIAARMAAEFPDTHQHLRARVVPYAVSIFTVPVSGLLRAGLYSTNVLFVLFVALICANVAALVFARTATRESEIVVRSALGASRRRIITQLFAETLVLGGAAVIVGLAAASLGLRWLLSLASAGFGEEHAGIPFWFSDSLSPMTIVYAVVLTVIGAAIAGVLPGLKVTSGVGTRLRQLGAGGGGLQFGGIWTVVIVGQIAVSVIFVAFTIYTVVRSTQIRALDVGYPAAEFLATRIEMDPGKPGATFDTLDAARTFAELERRMLAEPGVTAVTFTSTLPGTYHPRVSVQVEGITFADESASELRVQQASVATDFFESIDARMLSGRGFASNDIAGDRRVVVVNPSFVRHILGGRNPIGRNIRFVNYRSRAAEPGPWHEIVGVVQEVAMSNDPELPHGAGVYHPLGPDELAGVHMAVRARDGVARLAPRLPALAAAADPRLRLYNIMPLNEIHGVDIAVYDFWIRVLLLVGSMALLLSLAAIYSVMSFTVSRRTREIGIRIALGADRRQIVTAALRRPLMQAALGVLLGVGLLVAAGGGVRSMRAAALVAAFTTLMLSIVMLAAILPVRRALGIQPTEALKADA